MEESGAPTALSRRLEDAITVADDAVTQIRGFLAEVTQAESERQATPEAWSIGEIAHHLGLAPELVRTRKSRAVKKVTERIRKMSRK